MEDLLLRFCRRCRTVCTGDFAIIAVVILRLRSAPGEIAGIIRNPRQIDPEVRILVVYGPNKDSSFTTPLGQNLHTAGLRWPVVSDQLFAKLGELIPSKADPS